MKYEVILIGTSTAHPAANRIPDGDEEIMIVQEKDDPDVWYPADEFFYLADATEFVLLNGHSSEFKTHFNSLPEEQKRDVIATLFARVIPEDIFIHLVFELNLEENANQVIGLVKDHHDRLPKGDAK